MVSVDRAVLGMIIVVWVTPRAGASGQHVMGNRPSYADIVQQYREGQFEEAVSALRQIPESRLDDDADQLVRRAMSEPPHSYLIEAAIVLHTDAYLRGDQDQLWQNRDQMRRGPPAQIVVARRLIDRLRRVRAPNRFERCWYLLNIILALDVSASVEGVRFQHLREAAAAIIQSVRSQDKVALTTFSHQLRLLAPLTSDRDRVARVLEDVTTGGETALRDAHSRRLRFAAANPVVHSSCCSLMEWTRRASWTSGTCSRP